MNTGYDVNQFLMQFEREMGMSLFATIFSEVPSMLISVAVYVFTALALYTIAKRRGIHNAWLAWIPFGNSWLLGCISDQYRAVALGQTKYRRRVLLITEIICSATAVIMLVLMFAMLFNMLTFVGGNLDNLNNMEGMIPENLLGVMMGPMVGMLLMLLVLFPVAIVHAVFGYIALYDIYKSCSPSNAALYLVLSILISYAQPVFLFICRNQDSGMPHRTQAPVVTPEVPTEQEPWEKEAE